MRPIRLGDMVGLNMQTVAMGGMQKVALQSGGEVRYRAGANGQQVTVALAQPSSTSPMVSPIH
ncbi:MAG: hypothetical protein IPO90_14615 [Flavobacteriales bacterium]|nr:hypothetical protein [Flavobacteriales bacterium]